MCNQPAGMHQLMDSDDQHHVFSDDTQTPRGIYLGLAWKEYESLLDPQVLPELPLKCKACTMQLAAVEELRPRCTTMGTSDLAVCCIGLDVSASGSRCRMAGCN